MARGIRDTRPLPGAAEQRRSDAADARERLRTASLDELADAYQADTRARSRDRIVREVRRRGVSNDEWQAAGTTGAGRPAASASSAGTGNS